MAPGKNTRGGEIRRPWRGAAAAGVALLCGCVPGDVGYVEIKTVPVAPSTTAPLYLDAVKLEPVKNGTAVLRQSVGTIKLGTDGNGGNRALLCEIVVRKNRITSITVSVLEHPPRCLCRNNGPADAQGTRSCVG
jgi:hypothetical protein